jgi:hypothetical protein
MWNLNLDNQFRSVCERCTAPPPPLPPPSTEMRTYDRFVKVTIERYLLGMWAWSTIRHVFMWKQKSLQLEFITTKMADGVLHGKVRLPVPRCAFLLKCHTSKRYTTRGNVILLTSVRKVRSYCRQFSRNSPILTNTACKSAIPIFTWIAQ